MNKTEIINWLLKGDISIQYQVHRDLLGDDRKDLQVRIGKEGWGKAILAKQNQNGHWGKKFYQPKWTSTHYTLLDLRNLCLHPSHPVPREAIDKVLRNGKAADGGIPLGPSTSEFSDVCVNGMFLNYASYFKTDEKKLRSIVDMLLSEKMADGGFNCKTARTGAKHSSMHSTISVLEGFAQFQGEGHTYREEEIRQARHSAVEFILIHKLFLSDRTGKIINRDFLKLVYPCRWRYDILRALEHFRFAHVAWDPRMTQAMDQLLNKRNKHSTWNLNAHHPGKVHLEMEKAGKPSRWNTLRAMRVMDKYGITTWV